MRSQADVNRTLTSTAVLQNCVLPLPAFLPACLPAVLYLRRLQHICCLLTCLCVTADPGGNLCGCPGSGCEGFDSGHQL